ncbi:MerR family transcriptional regulator [Lacticaseibacillus thailandensis]|uniref:Transcriptional regulator n=1 Tax=Lacticaseibacillus thailandensis DSM 22698 = JCM 13996 TaxID=1423810 RepID=A0A0R2C710_9LACO|nr:MerR family transcriptional regulator [Lacticaseibacillus thailandensis]KRM86754.1 transcriptional regulator [Lacticaseibacillus thailandensis DSM 22698 = JCM 13996]
MITINKFATLAGTTRRTLQFYDAVGLFHPAKVGENGYRYYAADQLYQLQFILQLRHLGLSVADTQRVVGATGAELDAYITPLLARIEAKLTDLTKLRTLLADRLQARPVTVAPIGRAMVVRRPRTQFWTSPESVGCTDEAVRDLYQQFYALIGRLKLVDKQASGFLTDLPAADATGYATANFRILKAVTSPVTGDVPVIVRPQGQYVVASTQNNAASIAAGLDAIRAQVAAQNLTISTLCWQLNNGEQFGKKASTPELSLEYQII